MTLIFIQGHSLRNQTLSIFLQIKVSIWMKFSMLPQAAGLLKLMLNLFWRSTVQGRELRWLDFIMCSFKIVMCQDTYEPICCKLGVMLNTTATLFDSSLNDFDVTQGHRVTRKLEFVQSFCCKIVWSNWNICDGWLCKGDDHEEVP